MSLVLYAVAGDDRGCDYMTQLRQVLTQYKCLSKEKLKLIISKQDSSRFGCTFLNVSPFQIRVTVQNFYQMVLRRCDGENLLGSFASTNIETPSGCIFASSTIELNLLFSCISWNLLYPLQFSELIFCYLFPEPSKASTFPEIYYYHHYDNKSNGFYISYDVMTVMCFCTRQVEINNFNLASFDATTFL